jgi:hypothetical protein
MSIQPGRYIARATGPQDVQFGRANTGTEQIAVLFEITDERAAGERITWIGNFANDQAIEITCRDLRTAGWSTDNITDLAGLGEVEVELVIAHEADRNDPSKTYPRVKYINPPGGGRFKFKDTLGEGEQVALADRIKGYAVASRQAAAPATKTATRATPQRNGGGGGPRGAQPWDGTGRVPPGGGDDDCPI